MTAVYLVTVGDYESDTLMGAYSTRELAESAASGIAVHEYGRLGPFIVPMEVDPPAPTPMWGDGEGRTAR